LEIGERVLEIGDSPLCTYLGNWGKSSVVLEIGDILLYVLWELGKEFWKLGIAHSVCILEIGERVL
jgi:hypothetical protein